ncbi:MAG TPA: hypothetical protein VN922_19490 [Bacteroidia bacterium]|nr:hypothetical protein [Bacteroidia bacterium]
MKKAGVSQAKIYNLRTENDGWLAQVVLTNDGMFSSVSDYGNFSYAWCAYGEGDFREFIAGLGIDYFGSKIYSGMTYIFYGKKYEKACEKFAEMVLPALQKALKDELASEKTSN